MDSGELVVPSKQWPFCIKNCDGLWLRYEAQRGVWRWRDVEG